ncbi:hypothetical protein FF098_008705 [Parvularcula flava]|nr:energy transducer TonB [Aquisalinus luteolus]NHK27981.1 hypothetical protein [Aquisalinus luteolus]
MSIRSFMAAAGIACLLSMSPTLVQAQDYLDAFKAYQDAIQKGENERAIDKAEQAWELAEANGDVDPATLAVLAQNIAYLTVFDEPKRAIAPAERALQLGLEGYGTDSFSILELEILAATANCLHQPGGRNRDALLSALDKWWAQDIAEAAVTELSLTASTRLAQVALEKGAWRDAAKAAAPARQALDEMSPILERQLGAVTIMEVAAIMNAGDIFSVDIAVNNYSGTTPPISMPDRDRADKAAALQQASTILRKATRAFPTQESIETFDDILARLHAWNALVSVYAYVLQVELDYPEDEAPRHPFEKSCPEGTDVWANGKREQPEFPQRAARTQKSGSILLGFHLDEKGNVYGQRILAEIPTATFGDVVLEKVKDWKADVDGVSEDCRSNLITTFQFSIRS